MKSGTIRAWHVVHKWTSLVCTVFLLMLCITGLPLIFHDEIDALAEGEPRVPAMATDTPIRSYDDMVTTAMRLNPGERPLFMSFYEDIPAVNVTTAKSAQPGDGEYTITAIDLRTAEPIGSSDEVGTVGMIMEVILRLHVDLFADLPGKLFLGFMGFLFLIATISGVVLYAPFMRKLDFATVRHDRSAQTRWLDWHNLLGIVTLAWVSIVGLTGVINTLSDPMFDFWRANQLAELIAPYKDLDPVPVEQFGSVHKALETARAAAPGTQPQFVAFPGTRFSSEHHFAVWMRGGTAATAELLTPALIDTKTGELTAMRTMPWYMLALRLSQPFHFGDYAGLPLKILWALLDIAAIIILWSGLKLWLGKRKERNSAARVSTQVLA